MADCASSHSSAAVTSESSTRVVEPTTRTSTKKSSSTATIPTAPAVAGDLAQGVAQGVDGLEGGRGDVLQLPVAVLEEGDQRVVDLAVLLGHVRPSPGCGRLQCRTPGRAQQPRLRLVRAQRAH